MKRNIGTRKGSGRTKRVVAETEREGRRRKGIGRGRGKRASNVIAITCYLTAFCYSYTIRYDIRYTIPNL